MLRKAIALIVLAGIASPAVAQDRLAWKYREGQVFYMQEVMEQKQTVTTGENKEEKKSTQTTVTEFRVLRAGSDGSVDLEMKMLSVKEDGPAAEANAPILSRMENSTFRVSLDAKGQIKKFDGYEDFVSRVADGNAQMAKVFRSIMSEEVFQKMVTQTFAVVPNDARQRGETWKQKQGMSLGPFGRVLIVRNIQHAGLAKSKSGRQYVKLALTGNAQYQPPTKDFDGLPFKIIDGDLKFDGITGTGYFDANLGRLNQLTVNLRMKGQLKIRLLQNQQEATVDLEQSQKGTVRITNENPLKS